MSSDVSQENQQFIAREIAAGVYTSRGEALDAAVELLKARGDLINRLGESRRQLDRGECSEFDDEGLTRLFDDLCGRVREERHDRAES